MNALFRNPDEPNIVPGPDPAAEEEREKVDVDTMIERPDLGEGAHTFVAAGDEVPAGLEKLPRKAARGDDVKRRGRRSADDVPGVA